jgi:hypothetical protein
MSLPDGAVFAPGARDRIVQAVEALKEDPHAPREVSVNVVLHIHNEYPKHVVVGKDKDGQPITKIVHSVEEEASAVVAPDAGEPVHGS